MLTLYRIALATALLCAYTAWAVVHATDLQPASQGPAAAIGPGGQHRHGPGGGLGPLGFMARELNLTEDQRTQISAILTAARNEGAPWRQQLAQLHQQLHDAVVANGYDENQVRTLVQAQSPALVEMAVHGIATAAKVRAVLKPEQQQQLEQLEASRPRGGPGLGPLGFGPPPGL